MLHVKVIQLSSIFSNCLVDPLMIFHILQKEEVADFDVLDSVPESGKAELPSPTPVPKKSEDRSTGDDEDENKATKRDGKKYWKLKFWKRNDTDEKLPSPTPVPKKSKDRPTGDDEDENKATKKDGQKCRKLKFWKRKDSEEKLCEEDLSRADDNQNKPKTVVKPNTFEQNKAAIETTNGNGSRDKKNAHAQNDDHAPRDGKLDVTSVDTAGFSKGKGKLDLSAFEKRDADNSSPFLGKPDDKNQEGRASPRPLMKIRNQGPTKEDNEDVTRGGGEGGGEGRGGGGGGEGRGGGGGGLAAKKAMLGLTILSVLVVVAHAVCPQAPRATVTLYIPPTMLNGKSNA